MDTIEVVGIVGLTMVALVLSRAAYTYSQRYAARERRQGDICREVLTTWAARRSLRFDERWLKVDGAIGELDVFVTAAYDQLEPGIPPIVTISSVATSPLPAVVQIAPTAWSLAEWVAKRKTMSGDPAFDAAFKVWCDPPELLPRLMDDELRDTLIELEPEEFLYDRGVVEIRWEEDFSNVGTATRRLDIAYRALAAACRPDTE